jgi:hypothetical protein
MGRRNCCPTTRNQKGINHDRGLVLAYEPGHQLEDSFIGLLHKIIRLAVKVLAVLTVAG